MRFTKVGLTGGIATGKSTVANLWRQQGALVIDTDALAHRALDRGSATYEEIVKTFGDGILAADRTISRAVLGEIVFADEPKRLALNRIIHPVVRQMWTKALAEAAADHRTQTAVVTIPLLFEVQAAREFDVVVAVGCSQQTQLARLAAKGLTEAQALARIRAQWPMQTKLDRADFVIWNDGALEVLQRQADIIWANIKEN